MARNSVTVKFDEARLRASFERSYKDAQFMLNEMVYTDSDPYVPMDSGDLKSIVQRDGESIVYESPYAAAQYYGLPNKKKGSHPQATMRWFEVAKAANKTKWLATVKKIAGTR